MSQYKVVFFDVGDTLAYPHPSFYDLVAQVCQREGVNVSSEDVLKAEPAVFRVANDWMRDRTYSTSAERSESFWIMVYETFLKEMGARPDRRVADLLFAEFTRHENYRLYPDAVAALEKVRARGMALGVVSNWEDWLERLLASLGVSAYFDVVIASGAVGFEKPDPRIFDLALARAGVEASQAVHVGDSLYYDVGGARAAGITPVLVDRHNRYPAADCLRVTDLQALEGVL